MKATPWIKSARSGSDGGACVEQRLADGMIEVRDSKDPSGPVLRFRADEYAAWLDGARRGEFDHLLQGGPAVGGVTVGPRAHHARPT